MKVLLQTLFYPILPALRVGTMNVYLMGEEAWGNGEETHSDTQPLALDPSSVLCI